MVLMLLGCAVDVQLAKEFPDELTRGFACSSSMVGPVTGGGTALDARGWTRLQIDATNQQLVVFRGERLDAVYADDDPCDDVVEGGLDEQRIQMAWSMTRGSVEVENTGATRRFLLTDVLLEPDGAFAFPDVAPDFGDPSDYDAVELESATIGSVVIDGGLEPLQ